MALALECPACGAKHRIDNLPDTPTFRCDRCGQALKMPAPVTTGGPPVPARSSGAAPIAPPPRRRPPGDAPAPVPSTGTASLAAVSATVAATAPTDDDGGSGGGPSRPTRRGRGVPSAGAPKRKVAWYWRVVAWVVAVPLGFVITAWPAYQLGFIKKNDVLDIFVGTGTGRYVRLAIGTAVWALVTALLVQLFVEGGRAWAARRRASAASS
jgi:hypothetical protein